MLKRDVNERELRYRMQIIKVHNGYIIEVRACRGRLGQQHVAVNDEALARLVKELAPLLEQ